MQVYKVLLTSIEASLGFPYGTKKASLKEASTLFDIGEKKIYCIIDQYNCVLIDNDLFVGESCTSVPDKWIDSAAKAGFNIIKSAPDWNYIRSLPYWERPHWVLASPENTRIARILSRIPRY